MKLSDCSHLRKRSSGVATLATFAFAEMQTMWPAFIVCHWWASLFSSTKLGNAVLINWISIINVISIYLLNTLFKIFNSPILRQNFVKLPFDFNVIDVIHINRKNLILIQCQYGLAPNVIYAKKKKHMLKRNKFFTVVIPSDFCHKRMS